METNRLQAELLRFEGAVATRVRELRSALGMSQEELAAKLSPFGLRYHQTQIGKLERGEQPLRLRDVAAFATALGVSIAVLLDIGGEHPDRAWRLRVEYAEAETAELRDRLRRASALLQHGS